MERRGSASVVEEERVQKRCHQISAYRNAPQYCQACGKTDIHATQEAHGSSAAELAAWLQGKAQLDKTDRKTCKGALSVLRNPSPEGLQGSPGRIGLGRKTKGSILRFGLGDLQLEQMLEEKRETAGARVPFGLDGFATAA